MITLRVYNRNNTTFIKKKGVLVYSSAFSKPPQKDELQPLVSLEVVYMSITEAKIDNALMS